MESNNTGKKSKGGRPIKAMKRDQLLGVKCTLLELKAIEHKAKNAALSVSEYLRELSVNSVVTRRKQKSLSKEVLLFTGTLKSPCS